MTDIQLLSPNWPAPAAVKTVVSTRKGGVSDEAFDSLNVAFHVDDDESAVQRNREIVARSQSGALQWQWLRQVHGTEVHTVAAATSEIEGDALTTSTAGVVCCVMTADCLPVLLCNKAGDEVAVAHGGWRGLSAGILANTLAAMGSEPDSLMAWLGPAIGPCHFEVGAEVRDAFLQQTGSSLVNAQFTPGSDGKFLADLYDIARAQLQESGVTQVYGGDFCTYCDAEQFSSYRRDKHCGRMLTAIYIDA